MTAVETPEDDADNLTPDDDDHLAGAAGVVTDGLFDPPDDSQFDTGVSWCRGLVRLPPAFSSFAKLTRELLRSSGSAFVLRFSGGDAQTGSHDPRLFTDLILRGARLNKWVSSSAFPGEGLWPGVHATLPGSLIAHFTIAPGEEPKRLGDEVLYPSVYGARAVTRLLAVSKEEEVLLKAVHPLGKRAVNSYIATLRDAVEHNLSIDWLTRDGLYSSLPVEYAADAVEALDIVPAMVERTEPFIGKLDRPFDEKGTVRIDPVRGGAMSAGYSPGLREDIREAWGKYVAGTLVVIEPENPSLPRAPRRSRYIRAIHHVYGEEPESIPPDRRFD